jgi:hypothetical protein
MQYKKLFNCQITIYNLKNMAYEKQGNDKYMLTAVGHSQGTLLLPKSISKRYKGEKPW